MRSKQLIRVLFVASAAAGLSGCGVFSTDDPPNFRDPNFPNQPVAKMSASVTSQNNFANTDSAAKAAFRAVLFDGEGKQFYGPAVTLDGESVPHTDERSSTVYQKTDLPYEVGKTWTAGVQTHTAVSPAAMPSVLVTEPVRSQDLSDATKTVEYHRLSAGSFLHIRWTGGDPTKPVYIFVYGNPDNTTGRRMYIADDTSMGYRDELNFGLPIANTGEYTIPAQLVERYNADGATRTITVFDNPNKLNTDPARNPVQSFYVYVLQREFTSEGVITFSTVSAGTVTVGVPAYKTD